MLLWPRPRGAGRAVLPPHRMTIHAEMSAVGIHLGEEDDVHLLDDLPNLRRSETLPTKANALPVAIGPEQPHREVNKDVGAAPLPPMHASNEADGEPAFAATLADADGMALPLFPGQVR